MEEIEHIYIRKSEPAEQAAMAIVGKPICERRTLYHWETNEHYLLLTLAMTVLAMLLPYRRYTCQQDPCQTKIAFVWCTYKCRDEQVHDVNPDVKNIS